MKAELFGNRDIGRPAATDTSWADGHDIEPPQPQKRPLRTNVFDFARGSGSALSPLFPYMGDGDIVPGVSVYRGGAQGSVFEHTNSVEEVYICFGAQGTPLRVGQVRVGDKKHAVGTFLPKDRDSYALIVITHRQSDQAVAQQEAWTVYCEKCSTPLVDYHFDAKPDYRLHVPIPEGYATPMMTILGSAAGVQQLNSGIESRTCKHCGHVRDPFQAGPWRWDIYEEHSWCIDRSLVAYAKESQPQAASEGIET